MVPDVLHHPAELLGPEIRHRVVRLVAACHVGRGHLGHVQGHVPVLDPQPPAEPPRLERGAVPRRVDPGPGGTQAGVDGHAVLQPQAGALQPAGGRAHPDRGDHLVRLDPPAAGQLEPAGPHRLDRGGHPQVHPGRGVPAGSLGPDRGADRRGQRRGPGLHHGDLASVRGRRGGQFGADPAGPHDGQPQCLPALARLEQVAQGQRVVVGAQEALPPVAGQRHRLRPGRQHQVVEGVRTAAGDQLVAQTGGGLVRPEVHLERGEVGLQGRVEAGLGQELLGQRRPVVRRPRLGPDQGDRAREAALTQFLHRPEPGQARAGHHYPPALGHNREITPGPDGLCGVPPLRPVPSAPITTASTPSKGG